MNINLTITIFALVGGFLPALVWLFFWLKEDKLKPEPKGLLFTTFVVGGLSVFLAFFLQKGFTLLIENYNFDSKNLFTDNNLDSFLLANLIFLLVWAFIEEIVKYLSAYIVAFKNKAFDEPIDSMIYIITAAIGFSAVENSLFLFNVLFSSDNNLSFFLTGNMRFLGATVVHIVSSAVMGGIIGLAFYYPKLTKKIATVLGLLTATILHTAFNFFIIISNEGEMIKIFVSLWFLAIFVILFFEAIKKIKRPIPPTDQNYY